MKKTLVRICSLLLLAVMILGLLPTVTAHASAATLEEKVQAIIATAWAYYDKGHPVQYDSAALSVVGKFKGGATRASRESAPEAATPDETIYSVCSDFTYQVYYDVFGFKCCGNPIRNCTAIMSLYNPGVDPICVQKIKHDKKADKKTREEVIKEYVAQLQPGDIINITKEEGKGGHAMLFVGDIFGDGKYDTIQCGGRKYSTKTGEDIIECNCGQAQAIEGRIKLVATSAGYNGGCISMTNAVEYLKNNAKSQKRVFSIIRPLNVINDDEYQISPAAKSRVQFPRLVYNRTATPYTRFNDVPEGGTVTLKVELKNCSKQSYTIPVKETVPEGVTFVKASDGATVNGKEITWNVALNAGETKVVSYDCTPNGKRGETVTFNQGKAAEIPSNSITLTIGGKHLTDEENAKLLAMANGANAELYAGAKKDDVPAVVYEKLLNLNVKLPKSNELFGKVLERGKYAGKVVYNIKEDVTGDALNWRKMIVPEFYGGMRNGEMDAHHRVLDLKCDYLYPGDVVIMIKDYKKSANGQTIVYLGDRKFLGQGENGTAIVDWFELQKAHCNDLFYALRPTLAYDDIHTPETTKNVAKDTSLKFTDVKESDWFFKDVKVLVKDGMVSGMTANAYAPNGTLTYGQALKMITRAIDDFEREKLNKHWASGYLKLAKVKKWLTEDVDLDQPITRLQFCQIAAKAKGITAQPAKNPFTDTNDPDVLALYNAKVINGMTATTFEPNGLLTRAQAAKIINALREASASTSAASASSSTSSTSSSTASQSEGYGEVED